MAIACAPASTSSRAAAATPSSSRPTTTCPAESTRSSTSAISSEVTIGSGRYCLEACSSRSTGSPLARPLARITGSVSRCPRVVITPTFAPRSCTSALVATVVPCRTSSQPPSSSPS